MTISDIVSILDARILCGEDKLSTEVHSACCSDLMSDVLAFVNEKTVLLTGLTNMHVLRTAEILDLKCIVFARGKVPNEDIILRAKEMNLVVITADKTMFTCAGLLYEGGLRGAAMTWKADEQM